MDCIFIDKIILNMPFFNDIFYYKLIFLTYLKLFLGSQKTTHW